MERAQMWASSSTTASGSVSNSSDNLCQLLIRDYPHRSIAIVTQRHALIFRHSPTTSEAIANGTLASAYRPRLQPDNSGISKCMVELGPRTKSLLEDYKPLSHLPIHGTLGLITVRDDVFLCVITKASRAATIRPGESVERIDSVAFYCLSSEYYDEHISATDDWDDDAASVYSSGTTARQDFQTYGAIPEEHPCNNLRKLLGNGSFYYSTDFDLTNRLQDRPIDTHSYDIDNFDEAFLWNSFMIKPLVEFRSHLMTENRRALDASHILTSAIRGYCGTMHIPQMMAPLGGSRTSGPPSYLSVISRLSCRRAGTRFNARGIDDDGNVANFVETETTYWSPTGAMFSYVQVRGSVPVFWEQAAGLVPGQQKITVTRSPEGTQPAFDKHFEDLEHQYGAVHVVNLLSRTKTGEVELTDLYEYGIHKCPLSRAPRGDHALLRCTQYDFHAETKQGYEAAKEIRAYIEHSADGFAYFFASLIDDTKEGGSKRMVTQLEQEGTFRTNCLDCLDRTNLIQTIISQMAVEACLGSHGEYATADFWMRHSSLWADNGDSLSKIYAGTGALKTSFTRHGKMSLSGAMADLRKSAQRLYHNNFTDPSRQITIDMLLGRLVGQRPVHLYDPISDYVSTELQKRVVEFSSNKTISIWVGTFNLNGRTNGLNDDLSPWLCPPELRNEQPDIVVCGFQEIVELSPQQIMNSDPSRKTAWEETVKKTLNRHAKKINGERYVLLRSGQLVGAALCIFIKASQLENIKDVEGSTKKTGLSGMAGNKGAVAIRFKYANTRICFITAHLAAGFSNYEERNRDYETISRGVRFQRERTIDDHDTVIWLGDFNYRIGLSLERTKELIRRGDLPTLYDNDQLNLQMITGLAFPFYAEMRIAFYPTYKYDVGSDEYDTSEKARIPAWTDRILRKGTNLKQYSYNCAPLRFSDHRPVYAHFHCTVTEIDEEKRQKISEQLYAKRKADVGSSTALIDADDGETEDEEFIGYDSVETGLPPASSEKQRWWLENGQPARVEIPQSKKNPSISRSGPSSGPSSGPMNMVLNPRRSSNPFAPSEEPDWVAIPLSTSQQSVSSSISSSPYEVVNIPAMMAANRRTAGASRLSIAEGASSAPTGARGDAPPPPPPPPRRNASKASTLSASISPPKNSQPPQPPPSRKAVGEPSVLDEPSVGLGLQQPLVPTPAANNPQVQPVKAVGVNSIVGSPGAATKAPPPVGRKPVHLARASSGQKESDIVSPLLMPLRSQTSGSIPRVPVGRNNSGKSNGSLTRSLTNSSASSPAVRPTEVTRNGSEVGAIVGTPVGLPGMVKDGQVPGKLMSPGQSQNQSQNQSQSPGSTPWGTGVRLTGMTGEKEKSPGNVKPPVPAKKKPIVGGQGGYGEVDLLGEHVDVLGGWESLKPEGR